MASRAKLMERARGPGVPLSLPPTAIVPGKHQGRYRATKRTPRQELQWVQRQIEGKDPAKLSPRERQQVAQWHRHTTRERKVAERVAEEILETESLPNNIQAHRFVWVKSEVGTGWYRKWMPLSQWDSERKNKFKQASKVTKLTTSFGVGAGAGATVFGKGVAGNAAQPGVVGIDQDNPFGGPGVLSQRLQPPPPQPTVDEVPEVESPSPAPSPAPRSPRLPLHCPLPPPLRPPPRNVEAEEAAAAARIQARQRGRQARLDLNEQRRAATKIQSVHRGKTGRRAAQGKVATGSGLSDLSPEMQVAEQLVAAAIEHSVAAAMEERVERAIAAAMSGIKPPAPEPEPQPPSNLSPVPEPMAVQPTEGRVTARLAAKTPLKPQPPAAPREGAGAGRGEPHRSAATTRYISRDSLTPNGQRPTSIDSTKRSTHNLFSAPTQGPSPVPYRSGRRAVEEEEQGLPAAAHRGSFRQHVPGPGGIRK